MRRSCKLTLKYCTVKKRKHINALLESYRATVNTYISKIWESNTAKLNKETLALIPAEDTRLSARYKSQALKQALETTINTKKAAKLLGRTVTMPLFTGDAQLDAKFVSIDFDTNINFDTTLRLSSLTPGKPMTLVTKRTQVLNKWLGVPDAKLVQGCTLTENAITLVVDIPTEPSTSNKNILGIDIGVNKLISTSNGDHYGTEFKPIRDSITRKTNGSKGIQKARRHRDQYIKETVNQLPWASLDTIVIEDLKNLKKGKNKKRSKAFRKALAPWTYRSVIEELQNKAQQNRVRVVIVDPAYTSQQCPTCGTVSSDNRNNEYFKCIHCAFSHDADTVGALNIKSRFTDSEEFRVPHANKSK